MTERPIRPIPVLSAAETWYVGEAATEEAIAAGVALPAVYDVLTRPAYRWRSLAIPGATVATRAGVEVTYRVASLEVLSVTRAGATAPTTNPDPWS